MESPGARPHREAVRFARVEMAVPRIVLGESLVLAFLVIGGASRDWLKGWDEAKKPSPYISGRPLLRRASRTFTDRQGSTYVGSRGESVIAEWLREEQGLRRYRISALEETGRPREGWDHMSMERYPPGICGGGTVCRHVGRGITLRCKTCWA